MSQTGSPQTRIVIPCYDEAQRLDGAALLHFAQSTADVAFVLVDDGSRDDTLVRLRALSERMPARFDVLALPENRGKAEAVRCGMLRAFELGASEAGYWDADLATPLDEIPRFRGVLREHPEVLMVFGARVQLLGRTIERRAARHYLGRVFATAVSVLLGLPIYDTQCGAKLFRVTPQTRSLFAEPFSVGWTFDVELIARLIADQRAHGTSGVKQLIYELPLLRWRDVSGSKVSATDFGRALWEIDRIRRRYLRS